MHPPLRVCVHLCVFPFEFMPLLDPSHRLGKLPSNSGVYIFVSLLLYLSLFFLAATEVILNFFRILNKRCGQGEGACKACIPDPSQREKGLIGAGDFGGAFALKTSKAPQAWRELSGVWTQTQANGQRKGAPVKKEHTVCAGELVMGRRKNKT